VLPKQHGTANTCAALHEEELVEVQVCSLSISLHVVRSDSSESTHTGLDPHTPIAGNLESNSALSIALSFSSDLLPQRH